MIHNAYGSKSDSMMKHFAVNALGSFLNNALGSFSM